MSHYDISSLGFLLYLLHVSSERWLIKNTWDPYGEEAADGFKCEKSYLRTYPDFLPKSRVSDVLNRKRSLTMHQIVKLHKGLHIPYESLIEERQYLWVLR